MKLHPLLAMSAVLAGTATLAPSPASAHGSLQIINMPTGGEIVYGPLQNQGTLGDGLIFMLHQVHGHYGDKPQITRLFRVRGANSVATCFSLTDQNRTHQKLAGMVIVTEQQPGQLVAAVLTDDAQHFNQSMNPMLRRLDQVMAGRSPETAATAPTPQPAEVAPLQRENFPDGSGSVELPAGWRITGAYGGTVQAAGPRNEVVTLGMHIPVINTANPMQARRVAMETRGGTMPLPGMYTAYPYGSDPVQAFVAITNQVRQKSRKPPFSLEKIIQKQDQGSGFVMRAVVDGHDGIGPKEGILAVSFSQLGPMGNYVMYVNQVAAPVADAASEMPTLIAISRSYAANDAQIGRETAGEIAHIKQIGAQARAQADAAHQQEDATAQQFENHMTDIDRNSRGFADYMREQTVVSSTDGTAHGRFDNATAAAIVQSDPSHFEYLPTSEYVQGRDF